MKEQTFCASWDALPLKGIEFITSSIRKFVSFANVSKKMGISGKIFNEYISGCEYVRCRGVISLSSLAAALWREGIFI